MKKLLGIFAHPDDESYMAGGTIAKYVKAGWQADLVCATRGEKGVRGEYKDIDDVQFGSIRQKELESAALTLGVRSTKFLDYKDGALSAMPPGEIEEKITRILMEYVPDVVLTFEPAGITNHPDHIKLTLATTFAFQKYAWEKKALNPADDNPPKLYFGCMPESIVSYFVKKKYIPEESFDKPMIGVEDKRITTVIDISRVKTAKISALRSHQSQIEEIEQHLSVPSNPFLKQEHFIQRFSGVTEIFMGKKDRISDRL